MQMMEVWLVKSPGASREYQGFLGHIFVLRIHGSKTVAVAVTKEAHWLEPEIRL